MSAAEAVLGAFQDARAAMDRTLEDFRSGRLSAFAARIRMAQIAALTLQRIRAITASNRQGLAGAGE